MPRTYSAIMALVGMLVVLLRAFKDGGSFDSTINVALIWMTVLGIVGFVIGSIAEMTVVESVRNHVERELTERKKRAEKLREQTAIEASAAEAAPQ